MINTIMIIAKGLAMGAADIVPGVSGGTVALLTGIYLRLITAITNVNLSLLKLLFKGQLKEFWRAIDGNFILPLLGGIITAFILFSHAIKSAIQNHPILTWSFFFGLIIASAVIIIRNITEKKSSHYIWLIPGLLCGLWIGTQSSMALPDHHFSFLLAGMIAICAMILPGISGSFILLLIGMYQPLLTAVTEKNWMVLMYFIIGAICGLMVFSRIIKWFLNHYQQITLFFLSGLMLGSLTKIWPWKKINGNIIDNISPTLHADPQTINAIVMMLIACCAVFSIDHFGRKLSSRT